MVSSSAKGGLPVSWQKIKSEYVAGEASLRELAEKYGVSFSTIQKKSMEEKWRDLRKKKRRLTEEKVINAVSSKEATKAVNIIDIADKLLDKIGEIAQFVSDPDSIKKLTSAIKDLKDVKGLKTEADMREQEARIRNLEKQAQAEDASKDIEVSIASDVEEYSR
jgi:tRNA G10  N-methylase Trm11